MKRFEDLFFTRRKRAVIPFLMLGDPGIASSIALVRAALEAGADALELGIPFSDPLADGPVIQRSASRALAAGARVESCLAAIEEIRRVTDVPIGLLVYYNLVHHYGLREFCGRFADVGGDAVLAADLPLEESLPLEAELADNGLGAVHLIAPNSPPLRTLELLRRSTGFAYVVSRFGPTGPSANLQQSTVDRLRQLRLMSDRPLVVGFGISSPDQADRLFKHGAHGVIIGSALIRAVEKQLNDIDMARDTLRSAVSAYTRLERSALCSSS